MLGLRIRLLREENSYTQEALADILGIPVLQIYRYENNKTMPDGEMIAKIAAGLNTSTDFLLGRTEDSSPLGMSKSDLAPKERAVITAWRRGQRFEAIKVIVDDGT